MKLKLHKLVLPLAHQFTIARESIDEQVSLVVELESNGVIGWGEVTENAYYGHSFEAMVHSLGKAEPHLDLYATGTPDSHWETMRMAMDNDLFALSALDMAAHDWFARQQQQPLWQTWGLTWDAVPPSSYTIGIDTLETMVAKLQEQPGWPIYKIKLGTDRDLEIVTELRRHTSARFRVDANCGWTSEQTIRNSERLAELDVEFIEQPLPPQADEAEHRAVYMGSALPIIADESCQTMADLSGCRDRFHGVNVKLCKCGGLTPARQMLQTARAWGMRTMVGCMVESSIGISGAAHLLPLLDYADLDGAMLLKHDPGTGVEVNGGQVRLAESPGTGADLRR